MQVTTKLERLAVGSHLVHQLTQQQLDAAKVSVEFGKLDKVADQYDWDVFISLFNTHLPSTAIDMCVARDLIEADITEQDINDYCKVQITGDKPYFGVILWQDIWDILEVL